MLAKITLYDGTIYRIADKTIDTEDGIYLGRIKDELSLVSAMQEAGNAPATINLTIINHDDFIPHSKDLWAAEVLLTNDNGVSWRGKINFCNFDADGNLYVTASEKTAPELELQLPDEVRQVYTVDEDFHQSSVTMTIPLVIGGTHEKPILVPTILIDKTQGIYLICVGEIREVVNVYSGSEKLPQWEYNSWRGTAEQPYHKGFAYVTIGYNKRFNADGSYAEINVEVVGLKLGNFTEEECRNGALFLYYFLTTAATGINGWGCGIDSSEIDTASFQSAITLCNQLGYKLDGIMWLRQSAQSWIDQICQAIHGKYSINANGKRSLFIDYAGNASKKTFTASNMQVDKYGKNSYTSVVYNKGILSYDYNPITGLFMQSAQYENAESIAQIGEQKFVGESYLIKDPTTALAVLEYTCKRSQTAAEAIEFKTDDIDTVLRAGDVITINRPDLSINNALYQIQNISITDYEASISAVKFDTSVFIVSGTPSSVNWGSEKAITPALTPAQATNLLLSTGFDINPDGTGTPYISGTFTVPEGGWLAAAVQYGIGASPSNWTELALITDGRFKISPVNVGTVYSVRVRMITSTGHSDYITGQITATGDTIPPAEPTIAVKATDKTVTVQCGLDNPPYDMGGFQIYRKKSTEQVYTLIGSVAANRGYASFSDYVDEYVTYNYQAKSYDRSGNLSTNFSNVASVTVTGIQANDVAATALAMPTGSILRLSAKNCTTASIAEANGVKDVSGNGNHGKAQNGVSVVHDDILGDCFSFSGSNQIISLASRTSTIFTQGNAYTFSVRFKLRAKPTRSNGILIFWCYQRPNIQIWLNSAYKIRIDTDNGFSEVVTNITAEIGVPYTVTVSADYLNGWKKVYVDGVEVASLTKTGAALNVSVSYLYVGNHTATGYDIDGFISDARIYPRALSASEIKTLYMFPDDVTFGQMTADLIGANVIKAQNLVMTENVISNAAQINNAVFQSLIVNNGSTVANQVDVGGRNLLKNQFQAGGNTSVDNTNHTVTVRTNNTDTYFTIYAASAIEQGKTYTISCDVSGLQSGKSIVFDVTGQGAGLRLPITANGRCYGTGTAIISVAAGALVLFDDRSRNLGTENIVLSNFKLESGNKATDWTPAPEDVDASISTVQTNLNTVTTNIYSPNTTTINGGKITTGSITATQLSVIGRPASCIYSLSFKKMSSAANGEIVPNTQGTARFKISGTFYGIYFNVNTNNGWLILQNAQRAACIALEDGQTVSFPVACTLVMRVRQEVSATPANNIYLFRCGASASDLSNSIGIYINTSGKLCVITGNASGTTQTVKTNFTLTYQVWFSLGFVFSSGSVSIYRVTGGATVLVGTYTTNRTVGLTASVVHYMNGLSPATANSLAGYMGYMQLYGMALSVEELDSVLKGLLSNSDEQGLITADCIATDAIKSRNFSGSTDGSAFSTYGSYLDLAGGNFVTPFLRLRSTSSNKECQIGNYKINSNGFFQAEVTSGVVKSRLILAAQIIDMQQSTTDYSVGTKISMMGYNFLEINNQDTDNVFYVGTESTGAAYSSAIVRITPQSTSKYGLYVAGKARFNTSDYGSDEKTKKDFQDVSTLDKLKKLRVCAWRFDEEKLVEKENEFIDAENIKIEAENKTIDAENAEIEKENKKRKNRKDGEPVKLIPLKEHKKLREHKIADKNANHPLNIGCMAGEFNKAFGTNDGSEDCLSVTDVVGVCMRAIQELAEISDAQKAEIAELKALLKNQGALPDSGISLPDYDEKTDTEPVSDSGKPLPDEVQQNEKSDTEQKSSYTEKPNNNLPTSAKC